MDKPGNLILFGGSDDGGGEGGGCCGFFLPLFNLNNNKIVNLHILNVF